MKKYALVMVLFFLGLSLAKAADPAKPGTKTHDLTAQVISVDAKAKTITIKNSEGREITAPVLGDAVQSLGKVKAGQNVTLTCMDNEKGEHQGVTAIKMSKN